MSKASTSVKAKKLCCNDRPRCKRCPVVLKRLARQGLAERVEVRRYELSARLKKKHVKAARSR